MPSCIQGCCVTSPTFACGCCARVYMWHCISVPSGTTLAVCPSLRDRNFPRFGSGSELHAGGGDVEHHNACSTSPCKLLPVNPRPALAPSPRNRVGVGPRAEPPQRASPQPHNSLNTRVAPHPPHPSPQNRAAAAANVKFTERKARERAAAHCSTCRR